MSSERRAYIRYRLQRAREALDEAATLFGTGHLHTTVSRLYYACFYAVSALLLSEGSRPGKHTGVRALFNRLFVKTGRVPAELGRFFNAMFDRRSDADYEDLKTFELSEVQGWLSEADTFVAEVTKLAAQQLDGESSSPTG